MPFILCLLPSSSSAQTVQWLKRGGSNENLGNDKEAVYSIATDSQKNYYVLSYVGMSDLDVDNNPKNNYDWPSFGPKDIILVSFACDGTYRWSKVFGGGGPENINSVVVDSQDNVYVGGTMASCHPYPGTPEQPYPARIDSDYFFNNSNSACSRAFLAKFNSNGVLQYVKKPELPMSSSIGASSNGFEMHNDIIYWYVWLPSGTYADGAFTNSNTADPKTPYVLQYNLDGTFISATQLGTIQSNYTFVKYYRNPFNGDHYATIRKGDSSSTFSINGQPIVNSVALVCYDNNGNFLWKTENNTTSTSFAVQLNDISFDTQNNIFIAGIISGLNMDSFLGFSNSLYGAGFLMKTNSNATNALWVSSSTNGNSTPRAIFNNGSEIALTGGCSGLSNILTWNSQTISVPGSNQGTDVLLARFNSDTGTCLSLNKIASNTPSTDFGAAITKDASGDYIVGGGFMGALYDVNNNAIWNGGGDSDFFIAKFATEPCSPLSNETFETNTIKVYPNPTRNVLTVAINENANYKLYTITGQLVKQGKLTTIDNTIAVQDLSKGYYLLRIGNENGNWQSIKVLKE